MGEITFEKMWINQGEKIVSFQKIEGWDEVIFSAKENALSYLEELITLKFRFQ